MPYRYILKRLLTVVVQMLAVTVVVFFLLRALPTDPVSRLVGAFGTAEARAQAEASLNLDEPLWRQLGIYLGFAPESEGPGLLQGDLGESWASGSPVANELIRTLPVTLEWITISFLVASLIAVPLGMTAALRPERALGKGISVYSLFSGAQPGFWWGLLFVYIFYFKMGWAPAPLGQLSPATLAPDRITGFITIDSLLAGRPDVFLEAIAHLVLPVMTLAFILSGPIIKMVHQNMLPVVRSDFVLFARGCGLPKRRIASYVLRNTFAPSLTLIGILYGMMLSGAVTIEKVFSLGGVGEYATRAVLAVDFPAIQGVVLVVTATSLIVYLLLDLAHAVLDPRVAR